MSDAAHFEPIYPRHAIERCAWSLNFTQPLPEKLYLQATSAARELLATHGISSIPAQSINFDAATGTVSIGAAYGPQEFGTPDGSLILTLTPDAIIWQTTRYTRWNAFWGQVHDIVLQIAQPFTDALAVAAVKLEYWDRFIWSGTWQNLDVHALLNENNLIAWGAVRPHEPWHSHSGWFETNSSTPRRLLNVNVNAADFQTAANTAPKPSVGIYTMIQDFFFFPRFTQIDADMDAIRVQSDSAHRDLKTLLGKIIRPEMQNRVSLNMESSPHGA